MGLVLQLSVEMRPYTLRQVLRAVECRTCCLTVTSSGGEVLQDMRPWLLVVSVFAHAANLPRQ